MSFNMDKYLKILFDDDTTIIDEIINENESDVSDDEIDIITEDDNTKKAKKVNKNKNVNDWMENVESIEFTVKPFNEFTEFKNIVQWILVKKDNNNDKSKDDNTNNTTNVIAIPINKNGKVPENFKIEGFEDKEKEDLQNILQKHSETLKFVSSSVNSIINTLKSRLNVIGYILPTYIKIHFNQKFLNNTNNKTQTTNTSDSKTKTKIPLDEFKTFYVFILYNVNTGGTSISVKQIKQIIKDKIDPHGKILNDETNQEKLNQFDMFLRKYGNKSGIQTTFKFNEFEVLFDTQELIQQIQTTTQNNPTDETSGEEKDIISTSAPKRFVNYQKLNNSVVTDDEFVNSGQLLDDGKILQFIFEMNSTNLSQDSVQVRMFKQITSRLYKIQITDTKDQEQIVQVLFTILLHISQKQNDIGFKNNQIELYSVLSNKKITIDNNSNNGLNSLVDLLKKLQLDLLVQDIEEYTKTETGRLDNTIFLNLLYEDFKKSSFYKTLQTISKYVDNNAPIYVIQNEEIMKQLQNGSKDSDTFLKTYQNEQQKYLIRLILSKSGETKFTPDVIVIVPFKQDVFEIKQSRSISIDNYNYYVITNEIKEQGTLKNQFISRYNIKYSDDNVSIKPVELQFISNSKNNTLLSNSQYVIGFEGDLNGKDINNVIVDTVDNPPLVIDLDRTEIGFGGIFGFSIKTVGDAGARLGRLLRTVVDEDIPTVSNESRKYSTDTLQTIIKDNKDIIYNLLYESDESTLKYISSKQLDILGQKYGSIYVYNTFRMLSENLFKNRQYTNVFLENIIRQIFNDDTLSKIIVDSYYNGDIDENSFTDLFVESLSELLLEKWIKHVITEDEEVEIVGNVVHVDIPKEQEQTIVGTVNTWWNDYIYNSVNTKREIKIKIDEKSEYNINISLLQLYNTKNIDENHPYPIFVKLVEQLSKNGQNETEIIKQINSKYVDLYKELVLPVYDGTRNFINKFINFVGSYVDRINTNNVDKLNDQIKSKIIEQIKSMTSHSSEVISKKISDTIFDNCSSTKNNELYKLYDIIEKNNINEFTKFIYNKILKKIAYLVFLIKLYVQYVTNVLLLLTVEDYYVFINAIFIQGTKQFNTIQVTNNNHTTLSKELLSQLSTNTDQSTNNTPLLYFVKHIKVNIPLFTLSVIQSSEQPKLKKKSKELNTINPDVIDQLLTSLSKNMISMKIEKVGRDIETIEQEDINKTEDTIDKLLNKLSSSHDILKLSKLTSNSDVITILKVDENNKNENENILSKYLLYNLYTNTNIIKKLTQFIEKELYSGLSTKDSNKVYIIKTFINVKYKSQDEQNKNSIPLRILSTKIDLPQVNNAWAILNNVIIKFYEQLFSNNVCQLLLWQDFDYLFNIISSSKKSKSTGTSDDRITVSVAYNPSIQLSIKVESTMYIDLKVLVYPFDKNNSTESTNTIQNVKPIVVTLDKLDKSSNSNGIKISDVIIDFVISLTLKTEIRSGTFSQNENIMAVLGKIFTDLNSGFELIMPLYSSKVQIKVDKPDGSGSSDNSNTKKTSQNQVIQDILSNNEDLKNVLKNIVEYIKNKTK